MSDEKITAEELEEGKKKLGKVDDAELKKREEEKKARLAELAKVKQAMEEAAKKEGG